ncbi:MAG: glycosyltransferase [Nitrospira sp.]|nr:glycosyltransferase [Nitrospira sp.]
MNPALGETTWMKELKQTGFEYVTIPIGNPFNLRDVLAVCELIKTYQADVIHALDHRSDLIGILSARWTRRPVVASFLGWVNFEKGSWRARVYPWIDRMILRRLDAVITDSVAIGTELRMRKQDPPWLPYATASTPRGSIPLVPWRLRPFPSLLQAAITCTGWLVVSIR